MCKKYEWPDDPPLEVVWTDPADEKKSYCVFHAPNGEKWKSGPEIQYSVEEFNELVFDRLKISRDIGSGYDFVGVVFPGEIIFSHFIGSHGMPGSLFKYSTFYGPVIFSDSVISSAISFHKCTFNERFVLTLSAIGEDFCATECLFRKGFDCDANTFAGEFDLSLSKFSGKTTFSETEFHDTNFLAVEFLQHTDFSRAVFFKPTSFPSVNFASSVTFENVMFSEYVNFGGSEFQSSVNFLDTIFAKGGNYHAVKFSAFVDFRGCKTYEGTLLFSCLGDNLFATDKSKPEISVANMYFTSVEAQYFCFRGCQWPSMLGLQKNHIADEEDNKACEELYRAMKQHAAEEHDQPQVSRWHFREKLMQLKQLLNNERSNELLEVVENPDAKWGARAWAWATLSLNLKNIYKGGLTGLYWACSGFGERDRRSLVVLVILVALSLLANNIKEPWVWAELPGSAAAQYTLATIPFAKDIPGDGWVKVGRGFWQFLIAVQFTLFALAVRNRFRR